MKESLHLNERDWQALSEYLDGQLSDRDKTRLEKRMSEQADLRAGLDELRQTRAMLRSVRKQPAPRNFTISPAMVQQVKKPNPLLRFIPALNFASAASALAVIALLAAGLLPGIAPAAAPAPQQPFALEAPASEAATPEMIIQWGSPGGLGGGAAEPAADMALGKGGGGGGDGGYAGPGFSVPPQAVEGLTEDSAQAKTFAEPTATAAAELAAPAAPAATAAPELMAAPAATTETDQRQIVEAPAEPLTGSGPILGAASPEQAQSANDTGLVSSAAPAAQTQDAVSRWWLGPVVVLGILAIGFALTAQIIRRKPQA